jgi:hypothetical protein
MINPADVLPPAKDMMQKIALAEAEKASDAMRKRAEEEAAKKELIDRMLKPIGMSEEEGIALVKKIIDRAVGNGLTEVQLFRFPNQLCTDHGRAINQQEPGWEETLVGVPRQIYNFWRKDLRPLGYKLRVQIIDFPGGLPGDVGMSLSWS